MYCSQDFGIKYNCENGGPAPEKLTNLIYENTRTISSYKSCDSFPEVDVKTLGAVNVGADDGSRSVTVEVVSITCDVQYYSRTLCSKILWKIAADISAFWNSFVSGSRPPRGKGYSHVDPVYVEVTTSLKWSGVVVTQYV